MNEFLHADSMALVIEAVAYLIASIAVLVYAVKYKR